MYRTRNLVNSDFSPSYYPGRGMLQDDSFYAFQQDNYNQQQRSNFNNYNQYRAHSSRVDNDGFYGPCTSTPMRYEHKSYDEPMPLVTKAANLSDFYGAKDLEKISDLNNKERDKSFTNDLNKSCASNKSTKNN